MNLKQLIATLGKYLVNHLKTPFFSNLTDKKGSPNRPVMVMKHCYTTREIKEKKSHVTKISDIASVDRMVLGQIFLSKGEKKYFQAPF